MGIDDDEDAAGAGEHRALVIDDLGGADETASALGKLPRLNAQWFAEWHGTEVFHFHLRSWGDHLAQFAQLAHSFIENCGDDSTVAVAGRAGVAAGKPEIGDNLLALVVEKEFQVHSVRIVSSAPEAEVFRQWMGFGSVARAGLFLRHKARIVPERRNLMASGMI